MTDWSSGGGHEGPNSGATGHKNSKRLFITLAAAVAVSVVLAVVLVISLADRGRQGGGSAGDALKGYLEALARGDAEAALSYGIDQPPTAEFLTDRILKKQIGQWPIRNIRVLHDNSAAPGAALSMAHVHVAATFGDQSSDAIVNVRMDHNRWKLASAAIKFTPGFGAAIGNAAARTVTLFGKPIGDSTVYVFPGWVDIGTTSPYITVTVQPLLLDEFTMAAPYWVHPNFALAAKGRDAVSAQLVGAMANCQRSNLLAPPGCPVRLQSGGLADGTVSWGTADLNAVKLDDFNPYHMTVRFDGQVNVPITAETTSGALKQDNVTDVVSGTADLAKVPPELTFQ